MPANDAREQYEANRQNVAGRSKAPAKPKGGKGKTLIRLLRTLFSFYPKLLPLVFCCLVTNSILSALPATFMQRALEVVTATWESGDWASASGPIRSIVLTLICIYAVSLTLSLEEKVVAGKKLVRSVSWGQ